MRVEYLPSFELSRVYLDLQGRTNCFTGSISQVIRTLLENDIGRELLLCYSDIRYFAFSFEDLSAIMSRQCQFNCGLKRGNGRLVSGVVTIEENLSTGNTSVELFINSGTNSTTVDIYRLFSICDVKGVSLFFTRNGVRMCSNNIAGLARMLDVFESIEYSYTVGAPTYKRTFLGVGSFNG